MKITMQEIQVGRFYVREGKAREVITDLGPDIRYRTYTLETGELYIRMPSECSKNDLACWAERECTPEECERMQRDLALLIEEDFIMEYMRSALNNMSDQMLLSEIRRRGLKL